jgi:hypothetical protein
MTGEDACAHEWLEGRGSLCTRCGEILFIEAALALLADDEAMVEVMADRLGDWLQPRLRALDAARAVLAALRGKAFAQ